jgi:N-acylneuraminate cytidylyltransferase
MRPLLAVDGIPEPYNAPRQALPPAYWQTGHVDAIRTSSIARTGSLSGSVVYPLMIDVRYTVDIDSLHDWMRYEALVYDNSLEIVSPRPPRRRMPDDVRLIVTDFDGVITDNRVWTDQDGREVVVATRADSMRVRDLREHGVEVVILSSETNPVVQARAGKMGVEAIHGVDLRGKGTALLELLARKKVTAAQTIYIGNDLNDLPCFEIAGWSVAVADSAAEAIRAADLVLSRRGGEGAVREVCELVYRQIQETLHEA